VYTAFGLSFSLVKSQMEREPSGEVFVWDESNDNSPVTAPVPLPVPRGPYTLTLPEVVQKQILTMESLADTLCIPMERAGVILYKHKWKVADIDCESETVKREGMACPIVERPVPTDGGCAICWDSKVPVPGDTFCALATCKHFFHKSCFREYLDQETKNKGRNCLLATCPYDQCPTMCDEECFRFFAGADTHMMHKYYAFRMSSGIESNDKLRYCPSTECNSVVCVETYDEQKDNGLVALCTRCKNEFCFTCGSEPHAPATCQQLRL